MPTCECNIAGLLSINYSGIISASINGGTTIELAENGLVLFGPTINTLSLSAYPFSPGGDYFLGATCNSSAQATINWIQKYDCMTDTMYFIPKSGGKASISGGPINGVSLGCDPNVVSSSFSASVGSGPATPYMETEREDGWNLIYSGLPLSFQSASPQPHTIHLGTVGNIVAYLQSFNLNVSPPQPASVSYSFVFAG